MEKTKQVFLLSKNRKHYKMLNNYGYRNIIWISSEDRALEYLNENPSFLNDIGFAAISDAFYSGRRADRLKKRLIDKIWKDNIPFIEIHDHNFSLFTPKIARTNLDESDVFCILHRYRQNEVKEEPLVSKNNENLKILFLGDEEYFSFVDAYFREKGLQNITCQRKLKKLSRDEIASLLEYDMVITAGETRIHLPNFTEEIGLYLENHVIYFAEFDLATLNDRTQSYITISNTKDCDIKRSPIYTVGDCMSAYLNALDCIMDDYLKINDCVILKNHKSIEEIREEYMDFRMNFILETEAIIEKISVINDLEHIIRRFVQNYMKKENSRTINGIVFQKTDDTVSASFLYEGKIIARITFYNGLKNIVNPYYKEFNLEVSSGRRNLINLGKRSIYDNRKYIIPDAPSVINGDEYQTVEGIYRKVLKIFTNEFKKVLKYKEK